ncbi:Hint domain-containing protein [Pseudooctadecabacter jejudonensis]|uniref:Hedgehog/Intein (Hint) domain-containing protein n=1 Tax=Pseudooctadecabacter jejudonensis TaxID=1391910 RepID=A0A1Y5T1L0_9RHOB|nr:Hint domain-containing protein [Pseudooctadecabacter jejudonensis]SLN51740.1 hypothetical protein PSJ8397_02716 [Pseudooctadecabacter jejudonensis]
MKFQPSLQALSPWVAAFGITPDARIETPTGLRRASDLAVGDLVTTRDDGPQPVTDLREAFAAPAERAHRPVLIPKGAMGFGLPYADLAIGPQHRVVFEHIRVPLMFGEDAVLVRAKSLVISHEDIRVIGAAEALMAPISYMQISLAQQGVIFAEGLPVETILHDGECDLPFATLRSWELMAAVA